MKSKLKKIVISFIIMTTVNIIFNKTIFFELGLQFPHVGFLFVLGLLLGPYGAIGAVLSNVLIDLISGYTIIEVIPSAIFSFGASYLAYKLWYSGFKTDKITKPRLDNFYHLVLFLLSLAICALTYSVSHGILIGIFFGPDIDEYAFISYLMNFINIAFVFGIVGIWLSKKTDLIETPKTSKRQVNEKLYPILFYLLLIAIIISAVFLILHINRGIMVGEVVVIGGLLLAYLTKPFKYKIEPTNENTITETIIQRFNIITLIIAVLGIIISVLSYNFVSHISVDIFYLHQMPTLIITDIILILFFVPGTIILRYVETKVIKPVTSFSEIEGFISENEKIESEGLVNIYSKYVEEKNEIGTLARSYTELIKHNNNYIENIHKIEGEKERINAELDIARRIQAAALPTESLEDDDLIVDGYSHPAKEVGGDFFDYFMIDEDNLAIMIGDASGKGVPAALLAMITQVTIKQLLKYDQNPAKVLYSLNNELCKNNEESMFLTLWIGIYNKTNKKLTFSNAGHNPPLIKENEEYEYLNMDAGLVLGLMDDFEFAKEEIKISDRIILYTDGITDANNENYEMYGEDKLLNFFNKFKSDRNPITPLLNDIHDFTKDSEQYDDMTLLYLRIK